MKTIQENMAQLNDSLLRVQAHAMCARFGLTTDGCYLVRYPPGFSLDGIVAPFHTIGKTAALELLYETMEREWLDSYP